MKTPRSLMVALAVAVALPAAAVTLGVAARPGIEVVADPESGPAVRIARITDRRSFSATAAGRWRPTGFGIDPADRAATSRIVARTRGADAGGRGGNVILADGATVASVVASALTQALRKSGYRVLSADDDGFEGAAPVEADVTQFWGSLREPRGTRGSYRFEFRIDVRVLAPIPGLREGQTLSVDRATSRGGRNTIYWSPALRGALEEFDEAVRERATRPDAL